MVITFDISKLKKTANLKSDSSNYDREAQVFKFSSSRDSKKVDEDQAIAAILKRAKSLKW